MTTDKDPEESFAANMEIVTLKGGTMVKIGGIPFWLEGDTRISGHPANIRMVIPETDRAE